MQAPHDEPVEEEGGVDIGNLLEETGQNSSTRLLSSLMVRSASVC
jgi:hypothetical protein